MIPVLSRVQMRAYDKFAIESCHVPGVVLMENAGRGAADVISAMIEARRAGAGSRLEGARADARAERARAFPTRHVAAPWAPATYPLEARIAVICGTGNNGGDGFVVARHLLARGADVEVVLAGRSEKVTGDARIQHDAYIDLGGPFVELGDLAALAGEGEGEREREGERGLDPVRRALAGADFVIDALFGTGLDRPIAPGPLTSIIDAINRADARRVALDVPSGLDADSGAPQGTSVVADETVTFGHLKIGLLTPEGARLAGRLHVVDLGVPDRKILAHTGIAAEVIRKDHVAKDLGPREANLHKHKAGTVLVLAGSPGKLGAAWLTARAAMRAGAGVVTIGTWPEAATSLEARAGEIMTARVSRSTSTAPGELARSLDAALKGRSAVAIGPGLGLDEDARAAVDHVVLGWEGPIVVDADAITHFAGRAGELANAKGRLVLTPHPGELGRLLGRSATEVERDRFGAVREAVAITRATIVLKGARTIIASPDGKLFISIAGGPALATAGSGDTLTGIVAAFACAMPEARAAVAGVLVHGLAADAWCAETGADRGMLAGEIAERLPTVIAALRRDA